MPKKLISKQQEALNLQAQMMGTGGSANGSGSVMSEE